MCLTLGSTAGAAATLGFLLGVDYSEWIIPYAGATEIAADSSGGLYILAGPGFVTKLSPGGNTIVWQNGLGFLATAMAVDPNGGVYVTLIGQPGDTSIYLAKLSTNGAGLAWTAPIGFMLGSGYAGSVPLMAADSQGRAYIAAPCGDAPNNQACVARVNAAGTSVDYTAQVTGYPTSIAVDQSGTAYLAGNGAQGSFVAQLEPDGSAGYYSTLPQGSGPAVAVDGNGNAVVLVSGILDRLDSTGAVALSTTVSAGNGPFALDAAGNAYITPGSSRSITCGAIHTSSAG